MLHRVSRATRRPALCLGAFRSLGRAHSSTISILSSERRGPQGSRSRCELYGVGSSKRTLPVRPTFCLHGLSGASWRRFGSGNGPGSGKETKDRAGSVGADGTGDDDEPGKKQSTFGKIKSMAKKYGRVFVFYWGGMYVTNLAMVFGIIQVSGLDGLALLRQLGECEASRPACQNRLLFPRQRDKRPYSHYALPRSPAIPDTGKGAEHYIGGYVDISGNGVLTPNIVNLIVAGEVNELLEFARLPFCIATTPKVHRWWHNVPEQPEQDKGGQEGSGEGTENSGDRHERGST